MWLDRSKEEKKEYQACSTAFLYEKKKKDSMLIKDNPRLLRW